jgi:hypothetical protein
MTARKLIKLARAVIASQHGTAVLGYKDSYSYCRHCGEREREYPRLGRYTKHKRSCPVMDAKKILAG